MTTTTLCEQGWLLWTRDSQFEEILGGGVIVHEAYHMELNLTAWWSPRNLHCGFYFGNELTAVPHDLLLTDVETQLIYYQVMYYLAETERALAQTQLFSGIQLCRLFHLHSKDILHKFNLNSISPWIEIKNTGNQRIYPPIDFGALGAPP